MNTPEVSVVIPTRRNGNVTASVESLLRQTHQDMEIIVVVDHEAKGQSWARNRGVERARGKYILFSDDDVTWDPDALKAMLIALRGERKREEGTGLARGGDTSTWRTGYAYCQFQWGDMHMGRETWNWAVMRARPFVSMMSLFDRQLVAAVLGRPNDYPGDFEDSASGPWFQEDLRRLEDWDLFLTLGEHKIRGVQVPRILFRTPHTEGGVSRGAISHEEAAKVVLARHGLVTAG